MGAKELVARFAFMNGAMVAGVEDGFAGGQESSVETAVDSKQDQVSMERRRRS